MTLPRLLAVVACLSAVPIASGADPVRVTVWEGLSESWDWSIPPGRPADQYDAPAMGFPRLPARVNARGIEVDRVAPFALRAVTTLQVPAGRKVLILRAKGAARLTIDGKVVAQTETIRPNASGHEPVPEPTPPDDARWRELAAGDQERVVSWTSDGGPHAVELLAVLGAKKLRPEPGELSVSVVDGRGLPVLIGGGPGTCLTDEGWVAFARGERARIDDLDTARRRAAARSEAAFWRARHEIARREAYKTFPPELPDDVFTPEVDPIDRIVGATLAKAGRGPNSPVDDATFLRRLSLDAIGLPPTAEEVEAFLADARPDRRARWVDARLADPRWADAWMGYWQDVLAENPGILKPTLNNTGPFRRYLHHALLDGLSVDRIVTDLARMEGSKLHGGPAGFGMASQNDAPMAAKAHVLAKAFLAADLKCARCHDAPAHPFDQSQLFGLAGLLEGKAQVIPATSTVRARPGARMPAVSVSLHAGDSVGPAFDLGDLAPAQMPPGWLAPGGSTRDRLAALIVSPRNARFARVMANRVWARYMGVGLVEPVDDWDGNEGMSVSHPALLDDLARDFLASGYRLEAVARRIFLSRAYASRADDPPPRGASAEARLFAGPARRRLSAEQLVDSLFAAAGKPFGSEALCVDPEGRRPSTEMLDLGVPSRAWQFASTANERDRPALSLPVTQTFVDLMEAFGWRPSRQDPITVRDDVTTPIQPALLANGIVVNRASRLSDDSAFTGMTIDAKSVDGLIRSLTLRILSRPPTADESRRLSALLADGFDDRVVPGAPTNLRRTPVRRVSWSNHLDARATEIVMEEERAARLGEPPTYRLRPDFRERVEDVVWALFNSPEFVFVP